MERTGPSGRTAAARSGAVARLVVLCGLLLGLFLMHGSPASAANGCHRPPAGATLPHTGSHAAVADTLPMADAPRTADGPAAAAEPGSHTAHGTADSCLAVQKRDTPLPAVPGTAPMPAAVAPQDRPGVPPAACGESRAPPSGGRELLLLVCVARN